MSMDLNRLGWGGLLEEQFKSFALAGFEAARVAVQHRGGYVVYAAQGELASEVSGRFRHEAVIASAFPTVGDWVAIQAHPGEGRAVIHAVLPRRTKFSRTAPGGSGEEQVMAANIDDVFIVAALSASLNLGRLERYLALAWESGADPVLVLNKADLCEDVEASSARVREIARGVPLYAVSSLTGQGLEELEVCLRAGRTASLLGPSGVGKSSLINRWCGEQLQKIQEVRDDDQKGRHTTTRRELICLPSGALVIDNPGMRELQLWEGGQGVVEVFDEIEALALRCRFVNCQHETEPGCAVRGAVESGVVARQRLQSQRKLKSELEHQTKKHDKRAQAENRRRIKTMTKGLRKFYKDQEGWP